MLFWLKKNWLLVFIFLLAVLLRIYRLSSNPPSLNWDEVAIGWNAKTIFYTRRDEYGTRLPLSFKSFGDYKAPVYIYLTAPVVGLFGLNEISIRLVSVLAGISSIIIIYFLAKQLFPRFKDIGLLSAALLTVTPWHILLSRPAFEPNLGLFFVALGIWLFFKGLKKPQYFVFCVLSFALSMYAYHSPKIFVPLFLLGAVLIYRWQLLSKKILPWLIISILLSIVLLFPLINSLIFSEAGSRFQGTSVFYNQQGEKRPFNSALLLQIANNYLVHYSPAYLFWGSQQMPRLQMEKVGPLLLIEAPFLVIGLIYLLKKRQKKWSQILLWWLVVAAVPAMIGREVPHPIRSFNLLPVLTIITALGFKSIQPFLRTGSKLLLLVLLVINISYFSYRYFVAYPVYAAPAWQYGYKQAVQLARQHENQVDKIIFTSHYGQPHIFTLVYQQRNPQAVFWGAMSKYLYRQINWQEDQQRQNVLLIGSAAEIPANAVGLIKEINFPNGEVAFRIVKTPAAP